MTISSSREEISSCLSICTTAGRNLSKCETRTNKSSPFPCFTRDQYPDSFFKCECRISISELKCYTGSRRLTWDRRQRDSRQYRSRHATIPERVCTGHSRRRYGYLYTTRIGGNNPDAWYDTSTCSDKTGYIKHWVEDSTRDRYFGSIGDRDCF